MSISFDVFDGAFLEKIREYDFQGMSEELRESTVDGYLRRAVAEFRHICRYDLAGSADRQLREFSLYIPEDDLEDIVNIVSEGMIVQWLKPYVYHEENLENMLGTRDFSNYSPGELLLRIKGAYQDAKADFIRMIREYSYDNNDLRALHM